MVVCDQCYENSDDIIALVPARSGSKGVPDKNISKIQGWSLLELAVASAKVSKEISKVQVSTDSEKYAKIAINSGAEVPFLRPENISTDYSTDLEVFQHWLKFYISKNNCFPKAIIHLRPTTPFRDPKILDDAIKFYFANYQKASSLRSVHLASESPFKWFLKSGIYLTSLDGNLDIEKQNDNRQNFPVVYVPNGYVDVLSPHNIYCNSLMHGNASLAFETDQVIEIDTLQDLQVAENIGIKINGKVKEHLDKNK